MCAVGGQEGSGRLPSWCYVWLLLLLGLKTTLALATVFSEQVRHGCTSSGSEVFSTAVRVCDQTKELLRYECFLVAWERNLRAPLC